MQRSVLAERKHFPGFCESKTNSLKISQNILIFFKIFGFVSLPAGRQGSKTENFAMKFIMQEVLKMRDKKIKNILIISVIGLIALRIFFLFFIPYLPHLEQYKYNDYFSAIREGDEITYYS